jgi:hypothetical protein
MTVNTWPTISSLKSDNAVYIIIFIPKKTSYSTLFLFLNNTLYIYLSRRLLVQIIEEDILIIVHYNSRREDDINSRVNK